MLTGVCVTVYDLNACGGRRCATIKQVGTVAGLWRYPVKSMRGERLDAAGRIGIGDPVWLVTG